MKSRFKDIINKIKVKLKSKYKIDKVNKDKKYWRNQILKIQYTKSSEIMIKKWYQSKLKPKKIKTT